VDTIKNKQREKLLRILETAFPLPGYRERFMRAGLEAGIFKRRDGEEVSAGQWEDVKRGFFRLPLLHRDEVRQSPSRFMANPGAVVYRGMTSGTRGRNYVYFADAEWNRVRLASREFTLSMWGLDPRLPYINVGSRLDRSGPLDVSLVGPIDKVMGDKVRHLLQQQPALIRGYPGRLCQLVEQGGSLPYEQVKGVICTGECLYEFQQALLQERFNAPVINEYGCNETGIFGVSCPGCGNIHLDSERAFYEDLDGRLIVTDLYNTVMPMVRYCCSDMIQTMGETCPRGKPGPVIRILGRQEDIVRTKKGPRFAGDIPMIQLPAVSSYCLERSGQDNIFLHGVLKENTPQCIAEAESRLTAWVDDTFGSCRLELELQLPTVDDAPPKTTSPADPPFREWLAQITGSPWNREMFDVSFADETEHLIASVLSCTVFPGVFSIRSSSDTVETGQTDRLMEVGRQDDPLMELAVSRITTYAATRFSPVEQEKDPYEIGEQEKLERRVHSIWGRLKDVIKESIRHQSAPGSRALLAHAQTDLAIFEKLTAPALGVHLPASQPFQEQRPMDALCVHHLLGALERCWMTGRERELKTVYTGLRPLKSLLIGDMEFFISSMGDWLLNSWQRFLGLVDPPDSCAELPQAPFARAWVQLRDQMANGSGEIKKRLTLLADAAGNDEELSRVELESAYVSILTGEPLDISYWRQQASRHTPVFAGDDLTANPVPAAWSPLLQALVQPLYEAGEHRASYRCLLASTAPSSRMSSFAQISENVNAKLSVVVDDGAVDTGSAADG
jgi:phenylacetate-coenzyme A ligase PaaK-like adenylate-forming protein